MTWPAFQATLTEPWVLPLGVWAIATGLLLLLLIEIANAVTAVCCRLIRARRRARASRRLRGHRAARAFDADGRPVKKLLPAGAEHD